MIEGVEFLAQLLGTATKVTEILAERNRLNNTPEMVANADAKLRELIREHAREVIAAGDVDAIRKALG